MIKWFLCFVFGGVALGVSAQQGDSARFSLTTEEVTVIGHRSLKEQAVSLTKIDSLVLREASSGSLAEMLTMYTPLYIKSSGAGQLSTVSFRGTAPSHTQVEWNGINVNNPMLGQVDFSSLPVWFIDGADLLHGGSSLSEGSGSLGGTVKLNSKPRWGDRFYGGATGSFGSFGTYQGFGDIGGGGDKLQTRARVMYTSSRNDFEYYNNAIWPSEYVRQKDGKYTKTGGVFDAYYKPNNKDIFSLNFWAHFSDRDLPPVMSYQGKGRAETQNDADIRVVASWAHHTHKLVSELTSGYSFMRLDYFLSNNTDLGVVVNNDSQSRINSVFNNYRFEYNFSRRTMLKVLANVDYHNVGTLNRITAEGYEAERLQAGASASIHHKFADQLGVYALVREELISGDFSPFMPSVGVEYTPFRHIDAVLRLNGTRNYHFPTLNDLYWLPGGNPDLRPERGYTADLSAEYRFNRSGFKLDAMATGYLSFIDDWIEWRPSEYRYWVADNVKNVFARGFEFSLGARYRFASSIELIFRTTYAYTHTTNQSDEEVKGKQLIYIPKNKGNIMAEVSWHGFRLNYLWNCVGERYTTSSNEVYRHGLPMYDLHNVTAGKRFRLGKTYTLSGELKINNLLDRDYQAVLWRPMPRRNYQVLVRFEF